MPITKAHPAAAPAGTVPSETVILLWRSVFPQEVLGLAWHGATILSHRLSPQGVWA